MDKNQKLLLGAGIVAVGAYLLWKSKQPKASMVGFNTKKKRKKGFVSNMPQDGKFANAGGVDLNRKLVNRKGFVTNTPQDGHFANIVGAKNDFANASGNDRAKAVRDMKDMKLSDRKSTNPVKPLPIKEEIKGQVFTNATGFFDVADNSWGKPTSAFVGASGSKYVKKPMPYGGMFNPAKDPFGNTYWTPESVGSHS